MMVGYWIISYGTIQSGAATCEKGFVICFHKVPLICLGSMAAAVAWQLQYSPTACGTLGEKYYKTLFTSYYPRL